MKILSRFLLPVTIVLFCLSCSNESPISDNGNRDDRLVNMLSVTSEPVRFSSPATKAQYTVSDQDGFVLNWTLGDTIGIYPVGGDQHAFPISSGAGSSYAQFDGGSWALRANYEYAAYYPFSSSNYHVSETAIPVSYEGQTQTANGVTQHLAKYDYQAAAAIAPDKDGNIAVMLKHLGCFVRFQLTMPQADMYTRLILTGSGSGFVTTGTYDLSAQTQAIKSTGTSKTVSMYLKNVSTTSVGQTITLYMMLAPCNMSGHTITLSLSGKTGITYNAELAGKDFQSGKAYSYSLAITSGININGEGVSWGDDEPSQSTHEYVDLGLSVKWATMNVGATSLEEYGDYFAWGETEPYYEPGYAQSSSPVWKSGKSLGYYWSTYKYCNGGSSTMTKYCSKSSYGYNGYTDTKTVLDLEDDAASVNWGGSWRMPTRAEQDELCNTSNCTWEWTTLNGINGYKVTSKISGYEGNWLFLPAAGSRSNTGLGYVGSSGGYWSSSLSTSDPSIACRLYFGSSSGSTSYYYRYLGQSVRPVCP